MINPRAEFTANRTPNLTQAVVITETRKRDFVISTGENTTTNRDLQETIDPNIDGDKTNLRKPFHCALWVGSSRKFTLEQTACSSNYCRIVCSPISTLHQWTDGLDGSVKKWRVSYRSFRASRHPSITSFSPTDWVDLFEDVSDLWPVVKKGFEERLPFKRAFLKHKTRNPVLVDELPAEFILTTDARLRSRFPQEQSLFWFREPYATVVLVTCEDLDEFKNILKPRLKLIVQNDEREWFIVFVSKAPAHNDQATKMAKKVYARLEVDFNSKKRERCCKLDLHGPDANFWEDLEAKIMECIRNTLDRRIQFYEEEIRKLSEQRFMPVWNFCNFFILKESLAFMFEIAHLHEDALREYDELELCYLETVNVAGKQRDFGGVERGDDQAMLLDPGRKALTQIVQDDSFREFEFRQYLFACQAKLLFKLSRPFEAASRGYSFIISFSKALALQESILPFCMREVWVITACLALSNATASLYKDGLAAPDVEKEFYRVQGELYNLCRTKFMRLGYLIGYGSDIERSPVNSASLSMLPWPKPAVWPTLPSDASTEVLAKEKMILQESPRPKHFGIQRKPLPLEPSVLLREANRRRASLSAGNVFELFDGRPNSNDR
ncbi:UNVERIFIED_CONTAM: Trafficking protein particle complex II-specific subunit [Sesamum radiatum]|uniref:Trafficking protein particle complex II-specific subunit n=1 Tax=Sesamum radiatum TaxID=300843 RepID=A0AAW2K338_SESRA